MRLFNRKKKAENEISTIVFLESKINMNKFTITDNILPIISSILIDNMDNYITFENIFKFIDYTIYLLELNSKNYIKDEQNTLYEFKHIICISKESKIFRSYKTIIQPMWFNGYILDGETMQCALTFMGFEKLTFSMESIKSTNLENNISYVKKYPIFCINQIFNSKK